MPALLLAVVTGVHLIAQLVDADRTSDLTQVLLMPLVAAVLVIGTTAPRGRLATWVLVALFFSWLGDTAPRFAEGDVAFLLMVGFFLVAQVFYIVAFWPFRGHSILRRPIWLVPYAVALVVLIVWCREGAGTMLVPVVVYGLALTTMAVLATGLGRLAGVGGAIFMLSDSLIALGAFTDLELPAGGFWVMLTYVVGQLLLVLAVIRHVSEERA